MTNSDIWQIGSFPTEVVVMRDGPAPDGTRYASGKHPVLVARFVTEEDAKAAVKDHNEPTPQHWGHGVYG